MILTLGSDGGPVPTVRPRPLGKCLALSSANGSPLNARERALGMTGRNGPARRSWERIRGWFVKNGGSNRISGVWDCHVRVLSLRCCDPLRQAAPEWLLGRNRRRQAGSRGIRRSGTQLDFMGHDPKPASR